MVQNGWFRETPQGCLSGETQMGYGGCTDCLGPGLPGEGQSCSLRPEERQGHGSPGGTEARRQRGCRALATKP